MKPLERRTSVFASVLGHSNRPPRRVGAGLVLSVLVHLVGAAVLVLAARHRVSVEKRLPEVRFLVAAPAAAAAAPALGSDSPRPAPSKPTARVHRTQLVLTPNPTKPPPEEKQEEPPPEEPTPPQAQGVSDGVAGGEVGGVQGGVVGGQVGGTVGGTLGGIIGGRIGGTGTEVVPFDEGMTRPRCDKTVFDEVYAMSREARIAKVEGTMVVKCHILTDGVVKNCRVLKGLPHLTEPVLAAMSRVRCVPATFEGVPVSIDYVQTIRFELPK